VNLFLCENCSRTWFLLASEMKFIVHLSLLFSIFVESITIVREYLCNVDLVSKNELEYHKEILTGETYARTYQ